MNAEQSCLEMVGGRREALEAPPYSLRLYVAGQTPKSIAALAMLRKVCREHLDREYQIEVIDLAVHPEMARCDNILAVPTLVRHSPLPVKKIVGDLSSAEQVLMSLDLTMVG